MVGTVEFALDWGDVVWINMSTQAGHEQGGRRPALVLSPARYNGRVGLARVIEQVLVNGQIVVDGGKHTGALPGRAGASIGSKA